MRTASGPHPADRPFRKLAPMPGQASRYARPLWRRRSLFRAGGALSRSKRHTFPILVLRRLCNDIDVRNASYWTLLTER